MEAEGRTGLVGEPYASLLPFSIKTYPIVQLARAIGPQAADVWPPRIDPGVAAWRTSLAGQSEPTNLIYLHVPFCPFLCAYCPLYKVQSLADRQASVKERFVLGLINEIELYGRRADVASRRFSAIYFGGGTPSELTVDQIRRILAAIRRNFDVSSNAEISYEGVARQLAADDYLEAIVADGINRISFGVQSLDPVVRRRVGRGDLVTDYMKLISHARAVRPSMPINVDMMSGLSEQSYDSLVTDIDAVSSWDLDSMDVLFYVAVPGTRLHRQIRDGTRQAPHYGRVLLEMRQATNAILAGRGYRPLTGEVFVRTDRDLFVRASFGGGTPDCLNTLLALGPSAFGLLQGHVYHNVADLHAYLASIDTRRFPIATAEALTIHSARRRAALLSILQLSLPACLTDDLRIRRLVRSWADRGLIEAVAQGFAVTEKGRLWYNHMQLDLLPAAEKVRLLRMVGNLKELGTLFERPLHSLNPYELELREALLASGRGRFLREMLFRAYFTVRRLPVFDNSAIEFTGRTH
jgi:coproporphyrinogen III oxidase-like Fe-S oxidoreductase